MSLRSPGAAAGPAPSFGLSLAAIVALGPFAVDMYLASLPTIGRELTAPTWATQLTLAGFLVVLGLGQLVAGPVTDSVGRRWPLLAGLALFCVTSLCAAAAPTVWVLVAARLLQGAGAAVAFVVATTSVRDRVSGDHATRLYSTLLAVGALAPVIAPSLGGVIDEALGWRPVFLVLAVFGAACMLLAARFLPESLPQALRAPLRPSASARAYGRLLARPAFVWPLTALVATFVFLFTYLGGAPYIYQEVYHLSAAAFGALFGLCGLAVVVGAVLATVLVRVRGGAGLAVAGMAAMAAGATGSFVAVLLHAAVWIVAIGLAVGLAGMALAEPSLMTACMDASGRSNGTAAAVIGGSEYLLGAAASAAVAFLIPFGAGAWAGALLAAACLSLLLVLVRPRASEPCELQDETTSVA